MNSFAKRVGLIALFAASLAACATTPTVYGPARGAGAVGFSDMRIEKDRYRVTFQGGPGAPAAQVEDYVLLRAAQITLDSGYDWFRVVGRTGSSRGGGGGSGSSVSIGGGSGGYGRGGGVGVGVGTTFDLSGGPSLSSSIEIVLGRGPRPGEPNVYDARDVSRTIGARAGAPV